MATIGGANASTTTFVNDVGGGDSTTSSWFRQFDGGRAFNPTYAPVQAFTAAPGATPVSSVSGAFTSNVTAGNTLYVAVSGAGLAAPLSCTDSLGNIYDQIDFISDTGDNVQTAHFKTRFGIPAGGPCTITIGFSLQAPVAPAMVGIEWPGTWIVDQTGSVYQPTPSTAPAGASVTPTQNNDIVIGILFDVAGVSTVTPTIPFLADVTPAGNLIEMSQVQPNATTVAPSAALSTVSAYNFLTAALKFALVGQPAAASFVGYAPTVTIATVSYNLTPNTGTLTAIGQTPTAVNGFTLQPAAGSLTLTGYAPQVAANSRIIIPVGGSLGLVGYTGTLQTAIVPPAAALALAGQPPVIGMAVFVNAGGLLVAGVASALTLGILPITGTLTAAGQVSALGTVVVPSTGALTATGRAASLGLGIGPFTAAAVVTGAAGTIQTMIVPVTGAVAAVGAAGGIGVNISVPSGSMTAAGQAPSLVQTDLIVPNAGAAALTGYPPSLATRMTPNTGTLTATGVTALTGYFITPNTGSMSAVGIPPTVISVLPSVLTPGTGSMNATGVAPAMTSAPAAGGGAGAFDEPEDSLTIWDT
jgi:hypothetical protein